MEWPAIRSQRDPYVFFKRIVRLWPGDLRGECKLAFENLCDEAAKIGERTLVINPALLGAMQGHDDRAGRRYMEGLGKFKLIDILDRTAGRWRVFINDPGEVAIAQKVRFGDIQGLLFDVEVSAFDSNLATPQDADGAGANGNGLSEPGAVVSFKLRHDANLSANVASSTTTTSPGSPQAATPELPPRPGAGPDSTPLQALLSPRDPPAGEQASGPGLSFIDTYRRVLEAKRTPDERPADVAQHPPTPAEAAPAAEVAQHPPVSRDNLGTSEENLFSTSVVTSTSETQVPRLTRDGGGSGPAATSAAFDGVLERILTRPPRPPGTQAELDAEIDRILARVADRRAKTEPARKIARAIVDGYLPREEFDELIAQCNAAEARGELAGTATKPACPRFAYVFGGAKNKLFDKFGLDWMTSKPKPLPR